MFSIRNFYFCGFKYLFKSIKRWAVLLEWHYENNRHYSYALITKHSNSLERYFDLTIPGYSLGYKKRIFTKNYVIYLSF